MIDLANWISVAINGVVCCFSCVALRWVTEKERELRDSEPLWKREKRESLTQLVDSWTIRVKNAETWTQADGCKERLDEVLEELRMLDDEDPLANEIDALVRRTEKVSSK